MAKNSNKVSINLGTINAETIEKLSSFNVATKELRRLRDEKKSEIEKVNVEIEEMKKSRKDALEKGEDRDVVIAKYDILPLTQKIASIENKFKEDCKPYNEMKKSAMDLVPNNIYYAYLLVQEVGSPSAKGTVVTKKDKNGKVKETVKVESTMSQLIVEFANSIGLGNADCESAINKFATLMSVRTNGMIKCNNGDDYIKVKSERQYKEIFMLSFLQYAVIDKKVLVQNEDNTLEIRDFTK